MRYRSYTIALVLALAAFRVCYIAWGPFDLSPDEAHYWEWSRRLDLSYYSKGPAVAYVIALFTAVFGVNDLGVRFGAVVFSAAATLTIFSLARALFKSERAGFYSALIPNVTPIFSIGSILMTTDIMLVFFWAAACLCVYLGATQDRPGLWYAGGALIGLGFLSKYTMVLLVPCLLLFFIAAKGQRRWLKRPEPYVAGLISLVLATPVILWNILHGQVTIRHTVGQANLDAGGLSAAAALEFVGAQMALLTPLVFAAAFYGVARAMTRGFREGKDELLFVFFTSAPLFAFFVAKSLYGKVQANWAVAAFVTAFPAAVWAASAIYDRRPRTVTALAAAAIVTGAAVSFVAYFPWLLEPLGAKKVLEGPPYNRVIGWAELGEKVSGIRSGMNGAPFVISDTYQTASELAFYMDGNPVVFNALVGTRRMNQYDLWPGPGGLLGSDAVYVKGGGGALDAELGEAFDRCDGQLVTAGWGGRAMRDFAVFRCYGFKGFANKTIENY